MVPTNRSISASVSSLVNSIGISRRIPATATWREAHHPRLGNPVRQTTIGPKPRQSPGPIGYSGGLATGWGFPTQSSDRLSAELSPMVNRRDRAG
jgi:hypothetical protein